MTFEENVGQAPDPVRFIARGRGYQALLLEDALVLRLRERERLARRVVELTFVGEQPKTRLRGGGPLAARSHYFLGRDPNEWTRNAPSFARVVREGVYPGVDVVYYDRGGRLEYDIVLAPGVDAETIRLRVSGADGLRLAESGELVMAAGAEYVSLRSPTIYQGTAAERVLVEGRFELFGEDTFGFRVAEYDPQLPLVIDPEIVFSSYLGGTMWDEATSVVRDSDGNVYLAGFTDSTDFPTAGPLATDANGGFDCFVSKFDASGQTLLYSAYVGGDGLDVASSVAVDSSGNAYLSGSAASSNFPTVNALQSSLGGALDAFLTTLDPTGANILFSTYWGGSDLDLGFAIAVTDDNEIVLAGGTVSDDFPIANAHQETNGGGASDAFVTKLDALGAGVLFSTYLGGGGNDQALGVDVGPDGSSYATGVTDSMNFPIASPVQSEWGGGVGFDAFVTALDSGGGLSFSTYLGGSSSDVGHDVARGRNGATFVSGVTESMNFPTTVGAFQTVLNGPSDAFVAGFDGASLAYGTYLGGTGSETAFGVGVDPTGKAFAAGYTDSMDFPTVSATQPGYGGGSGDGFMTKLGSAGDSLVFSTYLGGSGADTAFSVDVDENANAYVGGSTSSTDFPVTLDAAQTVRAGERDGFLIRIATLTREEQIEMLEEIIDGLVDDGELNGGQGNALISKLENTLKKLAQGNDTTAVNQLEAFVNQVEAFVQGGELSEEDGTLLIEIAEQIIAELEG